MDTRSEGQTLLRREPRMGTVVRSCLGRGKRKMDPYRVALLTALSLVGLVAVRRHNYQWDFYLAYGSGKDFLNGVSPYRGEGLSFYQSPLTLYLYGLVARLPFFVAYELWLVLKVCAFAGLLWIWNRHFIQLQRTWWMVAYFSLAFAGSVYADVVSGNVSIFEQLGLWLGFDALLRAKYLRFCLLLILISQFKLTPIFFCVLLLLVPKLPQWKWFAACCAGFVAVFSLNVILESSLLRQFFDVASDLDERGTGNPSTLALIRDSFDLGRGGQYSVGTHFDEAVFFAIALAVGVLTLVALALYRRTEPQADSRVVIYLTCLAYCLMVPRLKSYSYIVLLMPVLHLFGMLPRRFLVGATAAGLAAMVMLPHGNSSLPFYSAADLFYQYLPLMAAFSAWLGYLFVLRPRPDSGSEQEMLDLF